MTTTGISELPSPPRGSLSEHLSFPAPEPELPAESSSVQPSQQRQVLKDRLYVGNLHPSVDEFSLLQIFSKFGKVTHLDFLFHKAGALKGKPRGYAFIEYGSNDEALKALSTAHGKLLRGRKLVVTYAHQAPADAVGSGTLKRKSMMEIGRPTTLSIIKTGMGSRSDGTKDKIAMMEAKLRQMEATKAKSLQNTETSTQTSSLPTHPSLPPKPPPPVPSYFLSNPPFQGQHHPSLSKPKPPTPIPTLPLYPPSQSLSQFLSRPPKSAPPTRPTKSTKLVGVKIGKPRDKISSPKSTS